MEDGLVVSRPPKDREYRLWGWTAFYMSFTLVAVNIFVHLAGWFPEADGQLPRGYSLFHWTGAALFLSVAVFALLFYRVSDKWELLVVSCVFLGAVPLEVLNAVTAMGRDVRLDGLIWMGSLGRFYQAAALWAVFTLDIARHPAKSKKVFPFLTFLGTGFLTAAVGWVGLRYPLVSGYFSDQSSAQILSLGALFIRPFGRDSHQKKGELSRRIAFSGAPLKPDTPVAGPIARLVGRRGPARRAL